MATTVTSWKDVDEAAKAIVGNWRKFEPFSWYSRPDEAEQFCLVYTHNRDSGVLDLSNAEQMKEQLMPFITGGGRRGRLD